MGRFKNELGEMYHLTPLVAKTRSGLEVKKWIGRLVQLRTMENRNHGPAFADSNNGVISYSMYEREILERFQSIQMDRSDIKPIL
jgi:hypothetical protein